MIRITAGTLRGRRIPVPPGTRPTSERARQAFFNIIGGRIEGARFLDLFAGSGAFSFEALSRGAAAAVAVEQSRRNAAAIERLAREWNVNVTPIAGDVLSTLRRLPGGPFDIVYADPPYDSGSYPALLEAIAASVPLAAGAVVAVEHRRRSAPLPETAGGLRFSRRAEYGEVWISFFGAAA
ncbi:MAG TPA: 16S rRNA (guanine(966)-N(2))-methyltransferase RsmD [Thermoanaerobaculia bacterium]|nr:16S rRNA (guanine(966)-N(2))-methyltransferase RsmD [Thermoanaerobaculia bacterium]